MPPFHPLFARLLIIGAAASLPHRAAAQWSASPHDDPSATGRALRHGAGIRPPEGRHVPSAHMRARLAPVLCLASFVVRRRRQWSVVLHALRYA